MNPVVQVQLFFDGASRGNPGSAGAGAYIEYKTEQKALFEPLGFATNNQAEYSAIILGLEYIKDHRDDYADMDTLVLLGDSQLVIKQLDGQWRVKSDNIKKLYQKAKELIQYFTSTKTTVVLSYIPREKNSIADRLANQGADQN